jgi:hypothetical protein
MTNKFFYGLLVGLSIGLSSMMLALPIVVPIIATTIVGVVVFFLERKSNFFKKGDQHPKTMVSSFYRSEVHRAKAKQFYDSITGKFYVVDSAGNLLPPEKKRHQLSEVEAEELKKTAKKTRYRSIYDPQEPSW